jgi:hypothetical protein
MNNIQRLTSKLNGLMSIYSAKLQQQAYERSTLSDGSVHITEHWMELHRELTKLEDEIEFLDNIIYELENEKEA